MASCRSVPTLSLHTNLENQMNPIFQLLALPFRSSDACYADLLRVQVLPVQPSSTSWPVHADKNLRGASIVFPLSFSACPSAPLLSLHLSGLSCPPAFLLSLFLLGQVSIPILVNCSLGRGSFKH